MPLNKSDFMLKQKNVYLKLVMFLTGSSGPAALERTHRPVLSAEKNIRSVEKEAVTVATKPRRGRRKLYNMDPWAPMVDSPHTVRWSLTLRREVESSVCLLVNINVSLFVPSDTRSSGGGSGERPQHHEKEAALSNLQEVTS